MGIGKIAGRFANSIKSGDQNETSDTNKFIDYNYL